MTVLQNILTPGRPLYWVMILLPNLAIVLLCAVKIRKHRAFLLVIIGALINIALPYGHMVVFYRNNGLNAPGVPDWCAWTLAALGANQATLILILGFLTCILVAKRSERMKHREIVNQRMDDYHQNPRRARLLMKCHPSRSICRERHTHDSRLTMWPLWAILLCRNGGFQDEKNSNHQSKSRTGSKG